MRKLILIGFLLCFVLNLKWSQVRTFDLSDSDNELLDNSAEFGLNDHASTRSSSAHNDKDQSKYKIVCYYTNWSQYRLAPAKFFPESINPNLCTHVIYSFAKINADSELEAFEWNDESTTWSKGMYQRTVDLKKINKNLKVLLAVGGWNHNSMPFSNMVKDDDLRAKFITKTIDFLIKNEMDGLDLDWEYPANRDTQDRPEDKYLFTILCKELHAAFKPYKLMLTAAVAAGESTIKTAYEIAEIDKYLDFINLMAYDLHGAWDNVTGHNAPLYKHDFDKDKTLNIDHAVKVWLTGVPKEKLILGLSSYGRSFKIKPGFESCPLVDTPNDGAGTKGIYTREDGFLSYYEVCDKIKKDHWSYVWIESQKVPFAYTNELYDNTHSQMEWVGFDDVKSIETKVKYIMDKGLGGAMFWSLDMDDFTGDWCGQGKYPLLRVINHYLNPKSKTSMPDPTVLFKKPKNFEDNEANFTTEDNFYEFAEVVEKETRIKRPSTYFYKTLNMFKLVENNEIQVYKFCQCKKGKQRINFDKSSPNGHFLTVNCNQKKILNDEIENANDDQATDPVAPNNPEYDIFNKKTIDLIEKTVKSDSSSLKPINIFLILNLFINSSLLF